MKRAGRLTALVLALLMLVNISASATTTGITLDELDMATYMSLVQSASETEESAGTTDVEDPWGLAGTCGEDNEYCVLVNELCALPTAQARYDFMMNLYSEDAHNATLETVMSHYYFHKTEHNAEGLICECNFPSFAPEYAPGALNVHHEESCPWHFTNLTTGEQYTLLNKAATEEEKAAYMATLGEDAKEKLDRVNKTEYTVADEGTSVQISAPSGTFGADYILSAVSAALNETQQEAMDALHGRHVLASFDISFADLMNEAKKLQPTTPVQLTFTIDTSKVFGTHIQVYHMAESTDANGEITYTAEAVGEPVAVDASAAQQTITVQASSFSLYALADSCDGDSCKAVITADAAAADEPKTYIDSADHNFAAMQNMTYSQMQQYINELYSAEGDGTTVDNTENSISYFVMHLFAYHTEWAMENICNCGIYPLPAPGVGHYEDCPWVTGDPTLEELVDQLKTHMPNEDIDAWVAAVNPTVAHVQLALQATSLQSVLIVDNQLMYVWSGQPLATYDVETGMVKDIATGLQFHMDELTAATEEQE